MSQSKRLTGTVKWFSNQRRYGFVAPDIGGEDLFVHYNSIRSDGSRILTQGDVVEFSVEKGENGRMKAVNVTSSAGTEIPAEASGIEEFGRGGGRNGRAFGGNCYNCGQIGHLARDCSRSYQGGAGGAGACFNCGQFGHLAMNCNQTGGSNSRGFGGSCYNCGQNGHLARDCNQTGGSNSRGFRGSCYNCGQSGHLARDCKQERANIVNFSIRGYSGGRRGCYNCGEPGHLSKDCPNNDEN